MQYTESDLRAAEAAGIIGANDVSRLIAFLTQRQLATRGTAPVSSQKFDAAHLLWYAGALLVIGAMGLFSTEAFSKLGGWALTATAVVYALLFTVAGHFLWHRKKLYTPGGLLIAVAVAMAPLAVYGVQAQLGWWGKFGQPGATADFYKWIKGSWIMMDASAILAGALALRFYRFPFIVSIIAAGLWFMSMDLTPWIYGRDYFSWDQRCQVSIWSGLAIIAIALATDYSKRGAGFAFWLHLAGLAAFWGGLTMSDSSSELSAALYCLVNVGLLVAAAVLSRQAYAVFGALGVSIYLEHLAEKVFRDSLLFPFALSLIGVAVLTGGLFYHRKQDAISAWLASHLPASLQRLRAGDA